MLAKCYHAPYTPVRLLLLASPVLGGWAVVSCCCCCCLPCFRIVTVLLLNLHAFGHISVLLPFCFINEGNAYVRSVAWWHLLAAEKWRNTFRLHLFTVPVFCFVWCSCCFCFWCLERDAVAKYAFTYFTVYGEFGDLGAFFIEIFVYVCVCVCAYVSWLLI